MQISRHHTSMNTSLCSQTSGRQADIIPLKFPISLYPLSYVYPTRPKGTPKYRTTDTLIYYLNFSLTWPALAGGPGESCHWTGRGSLPPPTVSIREGDRRRTGEKSSSQNITKCVNTNIISPANSVCFSDSYCKVDYLGTPVFSGLLNYCLHLVTFCEYEVYLVFCDLLIVFTPIFCERKFVI